MINRSEKKSDAIRPVQNAATYTLVVDQLRRLIYLGRYLPGDKLPPERELAQQLNVSRATVREAVRLLEGENLIRVKRGATGGILVSDQGVGMDQQKITAEQEQALRDIFEYRIAIESNTARCAAQQRSDEDLRTMEIAAAEMDTLAGKSNPDAINIAEYNAADTRFHLQIAVATRNPHFVRAVEEIRAAMFLPVGSIFERLSEKVNEHHQPILEAIAKQDPDSAESLIREHIDVAYQGLKRFLAR